MLTIRHGPRGVTLWSGQFGRQPVHFTGPYHGILPRALAKGDLAPSDWAALAPVLDGVLAGRRGPTAVAALSASAVGDVSRTARSAGVRSYSDSARTALLYAFRCVGAGSAAEVELWSIKEGHTSSVWRLRFDDRVICLNVARDDIAAVELRASGLELRALHDRDPRGVVEVLDIASDVLACAWIDCQELHVVDRGNGLGQFIVIKEFMSTQDGRQRIVPDGKPDSETIWTDWLGALVRQTTIGPNGMLSRPRVEACEGDLVLANGRPVLVALTPGPIVRERTAWEADLLDLSSGERQPVLRWGNRAAASDALRRALALRPSGK